MVLGINLYPDTWDFFGSVEILTFAKGKGD